MIKDNKMEERKMEKGRRGVVSLSAEFYLLHIRVDTLTGSLAVTVASATLHRLLRWWIVRG